MSFKIELQHINNKAIIISQLPTVSPTFKESPTKSASKGDVPRSDCIVKEIPRVNIKILIHKNILHFNQPLHRYFRCIYNKNILY